MAPSTRAITEKSTIEPLAFDSPGFAAWRGLIFSSSRLMKELDEELQGAHVLTLGEFDVLRALRTRI